MAERVLALALERRPDLVVISGDLTQRAKPRQFRDARAWVDRFEDAGLSTLAVPGNHDVPMYRFWERAGSPFGAYREHFATELEPEHHDDEMAVIGVNTARSLTIRDGLIKTSRLKRLATQLAAVPEHKARIVVAHHHLVPPPRFDTQRVTINAPEIVDLLAEARVDLVLSGHLHQSFIGSTEAYYPRLRSPVLLVHSGTSTSDRGRGCEHGRNTCFWIRIETDGIELSSLEVGATSIDELSRHRYPRNRIGSLGPFGAGI